MSRRSTKVIAISRETGERLEFDTIYALAKHIGTSVPSVCQALDRGRSGSVKGWSVYHTPERYREKIKEYQEIIRELEHYD